MKEKRDRAELLHSGKKKGSLCRKADERAGIPKKGPSPKARAGCGKSNPRRGRGNVAARKNLGTGTGQYKS